MTGTDPGGPELLESGSERLGWGGWLGWLNGATGVGGRARALTGLGRRHRWAATAGAAATVTAAALGYHWYDGRPPVVPDIQITADRSADTVPLWSAGSDGRPSSALTLSVSSSLADLADSAGGTQVIPVGLSGPGVSSTGAFPRSALTRNPVSVELTGQVACDRVPIPVPTGAYSVRVEVTDGGRSRLADLPLGSADTAVAGRVTVGCSTWLAARDVTLTRVTSAVVDPVLPHVDLMLTVSNRGDLPALLWNQDQTGSGVRVTAVDQAVPAHGRATLAVSVDLDQCWSWDDTSQPVTALDTPLDLLAAAGVAHPIPADQVPLNQADSGLVLSPVAAQQLRDAFVRACGGVASMVLLSDTGGARYDAKRHRLTVRVLVDTPPGIVDGLRLLPTTAGGTDLVPLFGPSPWLVPDQSGQAHFVVSFAVPGDAPCLGGGPFVALDVLARTGPIGSAYRVVRFSLSGETFLPAVQVQAACAGA